MWDGQVYEGWRHTLIDAVHTVCPNCKGELERSTISEMRCRRCDFPYRAHFGILDLRYPIDVDEKENVVVQKLIAAYPTASYLGLVEILSSTIDAAQLPERLLPHYRQHRTSQVSRGSQFANMFLARLQDYYGVPETTLALEIGCGAGAGLVALAKRFSNVVGLDPNLSLLILARKFCDENGIRNVTLVQAYGQHLPFRDNSFAYTTAQNVLEHVFQINEVVAEAARVLKPGGCFVADSRNRFDLFFPEPHVQLRWVGLLPRRWANAYVRWRLGVSYDKFGTRLLSYGDLRRALRKPFGNQYQIVMPGVSAYGATSRWDGLLIALDRFGWVRRLVLSIFPSHLILAQKADVTRP